MPPIFTPQGLRAEPLPTYEMKEAAAAILGYLLNPPARSLGEHLTLRGKRPAGLTPEEMKQRGRPKEIRDVASMVWRVMEANLAPAVREAIEAAASLPLGERLPAPRLPVPAYVSVALPPAAPGKRSVRLAPLGLVVLHELEAEPRPVGEFHTATANHLRRLGLVTAERRKSPYAGRPDPLPHLCITDAGRAALALGRQAIPAPASRLPARPAPSEAYAHA